MNKNQKMLGVSLLALAISGCAVTSQPIERSASQQRAQSDLQAMFADQEPLSGPLTLHEAMARAVKESKTMLIVPNAGADAITGPLCAPNIVRSSFSNWQPGYAAGVVAAGKGYKRAMSITWNYAAGEEAFEFLNDGAVAAHRAVQTLQIAIDDKNQVVEFFARGQ